ncbi:MAG: hypothetical protein WCG99_02200 [Candidatus Berkelbacteria bacterium]
MNSALYGILFLLVVAIAIAAIAIRRSEIKATRADFARLPIRIPITMLYLDGGEPSFVYVREGDGGEVNRSVYGCTPNRVRGQYNVSRHVIYHDVDSDEDYMLIRAPYPEEASWVKDGKTSPSSGYCLRYVLEFHLAPGNVPHAD